MRRCSTWLLACAWAWMSVGAWAGPPQADGEALTPEHCLLCHGSTGQGNPAVGAPRLAGMQPWYVRRQLAAFRSGVRGTHPADPNGAAMQSVALAMPSTPHEDALVDHVTHLPLHPSPPTLAGDPARGQVLFAACASCHGHRGEGNEALDAPALAALNDWYIALQLQHFRDGTRGAVDGDAAGARMRAATSAGLPDDSAIADLAAYVARLPAPPGLAGAAP